MSQIDLPTDFDFQQAGRQVLEIEREGLAQLDQYINEDFTHACETIFRCGGKVVVMGMGKSGHIGRKMAATFASTGTSAFFVHPGEAAHGDLGMVTPQDVVIALSNSGESNEILALIPVLKRQQVTTISTCWRGWSAMRSWTLLSTSPPITCCITCSRISLNYATRRWPGRAQRHSPTVATNVR